jgi:hypothetical protein
MQLARMGERPATSNHSAVDKKAAHLLWFVGDSTIECNPVGFEALSTLC